jgi:hypothetical protein
VADKGLKKQAPEFSSVSTKIKTNFKKGVFKMKRLLLFVVTIVFLLTGTAAAVDNSTALPLKDAARTSVKKSLSPQATMPKVTTGARPVFTMTCPNANEIVLNISYVITSWEINPYQLSPGSFTRASATIDSSDKTKVTLACYYHAETDYTAKTSYNGNQTCYCNAATGEGMINYRIQTPSGYKTNIAGTSAPGKLPVKKTGESIQNQILECRFHLNGQVQLFKASKAPANLSGCQVNGRDVTCPY